MNRRTTTQESCCRRSRIRRCRFTNEGNAVADPLDAYIDAVASVLGLTVEESWKPAVRANLAVTLKMARAVDEFPLPDETEPASVFTA
jgi:hypothetical protein